MLHPILTTFTAWWEQVLGRPLSLLVSRPLYVMSNKSRKSCGIFDFATMNDLLEEIAIADRY